MKANHAYLQAMDIQTWQLRTPIAPDIVQTVLGADNLSADLMIIGDAPGFYENQQGEPFADRADQLLNAMLKAIGFERDTVHIANCAPSNNRDSEAEEVERCSSFLAKQIALVQPKLLLALGEIAAHSLLDTKASLEELRNKMHLYQQIPLLITYHPTDLLRSPKDKGKAFQDLQLVYKTLLGN